MQELFQLPRQPWHRVLGRNSPPAADDPQVAVVGVPGDVGPDRASEPADLYELVRCRAGFLHVMGDPLVQFCDPARQ